ncbi:MAG: cation transporter [Clostridia bacterium]|nr:cation transporter [Clostridia bacterium]
MKKIFSLFIKNANDVTNPEVRFKYASVTSVFGVIVNAILVAIKFIAFLLSGSVSILADALNNLSDASTSIVGFIGFKLSMRPADKEHPYGHGRYEYVTALLVCIIIMVIGVELFKSGVEKIITPSPVELTLTTLIILLSSIILKIFLSVLNGVGGKLIKSNTLLATMQDSRNDAIATFAVLISLVINHFFSVNLDGYMTVAVAIFIFISGIGIIRDTVSGLVGKPPEKETVEKIKQKLLSNEGVLGIHDLIVHDYGVGRQFASVHVEMAAEGDVILSHELIDAIEKRFLEEDGLEIVIHFDPVSTTNPLAVEMRDYLTSNVSAVNDKLSVHDVRIVEGKYRNIVIFDCVMPHSVPFTEKELKLRLDELVKLKYPSFDTVVTIDKVFE